MPEHPITPPHKLVEKWYKEWLNCRYIGLEGYIATQAARWGADTELEACVEWIHDWYGRGSDEVAGNLRADRRPKPPSLKEQALLAIDTAVADDRLSADVASVVRRALEQLDD